MSVTQSFRMWAYVAKIATKSSFKDFEAYAMMLFKWVVPLFVALGPRYVGAQENIRSGNFYLLGCHDFVGQNFVDQQAIFRAGACFGAVDVLQGFMKGSGATCMEPTVTMNQIMRVVLKFLEDHPARLNEDFVILASTAIHDAWPCVAGKHK